MNFVTVNCGTNELTNLTVQTIFKFHPHATVFIVDVPNGRGLFSLMDNRFRNKVHVIKGIPWNRTSLPTINIDTLDYLTPGQKARAKAILGNPYKVICRCGFNHQENIQLAVNVIGENFVLMDSDAPLIHPIDFIDDNYITVADIASENTTNTPRKFLSDHFIRFVPFVQYLNVKMMKENGVVYSDNPNLHKYLDIARVSRTPTEASLWVETGSVFFKEVDSRKLPWKKIDWKNYVEHLGAASYRKNESERAEFIKRFKTHMQ